jgi:hypothetical protein
MQSALWESDFIQDPMTRVLIKSQIATTLARVYVALGQLDDAIELCQGSLSIIDQPGYLSVSTTHEILSVIHALKQDWDKAVYHYNQYGQSLPQSDRDNPANRRSEWDMIAEVVTDKQYLRALRTAEKELDKRVGKKFWFW